LRHQLRSVDLTAAERHPPIVETGLRTLAWASEEDTRAFAGRLAAHPAIRNAFIELHGELGAGKTTLVRHILRSLGVQGRVKSPTYAVVEPYSVRTELVEVPELAIWHFDFYRFSDPREWEDAGFRDLFSSPGLKLAEWPEKAGALLPTADLVVSITVGDDETRHVTLKAQTPAGVELLA
jgi:tRNA threonylcarbamoyladenosine biosynthesis protein TsaE